MSRAAEPIGPKRYRRGRPWSPEKHGLIQYYLGGTGHKGGGFMKATQNAGGSYYIDLFSGPGQVEMEDGQIIDGSPLIAARASPPFARLFWVDADPSNAASLRAHRQDFPNRAIDVFEADANEVINVILDGVPVTQPAVAFLDPEGSELHWETIRRIAFHKPSPRNKIEQFILFHTDTGIVRFFPREPAKMVHADRLDRMLPDPGAWRDLYGLRLKLDGPEFRRRLVGLYVDGLRGLEYRYVPDPRLICRPDGRPLYFMVFATDHPAGEAIMRSALEKVETTMRQPSLLPYNQRY
jgi:three-Cys-motif partner protein